MKKEIRTASLKQNLLVLRKKRLYLHFLVDEAVLQICRCFNGHKIYSISFDDIIVNLDKTELKNLVNFKFKF